MTDSGKLDLIITEIHGMREDIHVLKEDVHVLKEEMKEVKGEIRVLKEDVRVLKEDARVLMEDARVLKEDVLVLKEDMENVKHAVKKTNLIIENELRVNIQRVAEGHLDLSRKLEEAKKPNEEFEVLSLKVRMLESNVSGLQEKFA